MPTSKNKTTDRWDKHSVQTTGVLLRRTQDYLDNCASDSKYPTKAGLLLHLGFSSSKEIAEYCGQKGKSWPRVLSRAYLLLEDALNQEMLHRDRRNSNGIVRYMAAQFKEYSEKIDMKGDTSVKFVYFPNKLPVGSPMDKPTVQKMYKGKKKAVENGIQ